MMFLCRMRFTARASETNRETTPASEANFLCSSLMATFFPMSGCSAA